VTDRTSVTVGPWPESTGDEGSEQPQGADPSAEVVSMTTRTFEKLIDELGSQAEQNARLRAALAIRPAVSLATGVLMFRYGLEEKQALDLLSRWSEKNDTGLREFALAVLEIAASDPESLEQRLLGVPPKEAGP
jgi:hypothetical protein